MVKRHQYCPNSDKKEEQWRCLYVGGTLIEEAKLGTASHGLVSVGGKHVRCGPNWRRPEQGQKSFGRPDGKRPRENVVTEHFGVPPAKWTEEAG